MKRDSGYLNHLGRLCLRMAKDPVNLLLMALLSAIALFVLIFCASI